MFLKLLQGVQGVQNQGRVFTKRFHTQMCLATLFDQRRKVENKWKNMEWNDDEDEQRRAFQEEERKNIQKQKKDQQNLKCEITDKIKRPGSIDCTCKEICMARKSETYIIHYEGGIGMIQNK